MDHIKCLKEISVTDVVLLDVKFTDDIGENMTPEQEAHLKHIKTNFTSKVDVKYRAGQKEHGGDLIHDNALSLIDKAISEAIDQVVYLETLREVMVGK